MPVAQFARARMAERLGPLSQGGDPKKPLLPVADGVPPLPPGGGGAPSRDLLSKFLAARDARPGFMTDTLVTTMAVSMAFAGSETTAISLAAVFYYLLRSPGALARLRREIDAAARAGAFSDRETGLVTWAESQRLPYLDACVKEAFRMHPAAGLPLERIVPAQGAEVVGRHVRGGTVVGCSAWIIHRRPEIWGDDVDVYRPERWLVEGEETGATLTEADRAERERRVREMNGMMFQFGMGSRTCIGKNISLLEIYKVVPSLLRRFEVSFYYIYIYISTAYKVLVGYFYTCPPSQPVMPDGEKLIPVYDRSGSRTQAKSGSSSMPGLSSSRTSKPFLSCGTSSNQRETPPLAPLTMRRRRG